MIDQLVYVQILKDLEINTNKKMIYKLLKVLYGLKQAPRLSKFLLKKTELQINQCRP